jgi:hypothetical protein
MALFLVAVLAVATSFPALSAPSLGHSTSPVIADTPHCELGSQVIADWVPKADARRRVLLDPQPVRHFPFQLWSPQSLLMRQWDRTASSGLFGGCGDLLRSSRAREVVPTGGTERLLDPAAHHNVLIYGISRPLVSLANDEAIVQVEWRCPGLCGGGVVVRYLRSGQHWVRDRVVGSWAS